MRGASELGPEAAIWAPQRVTNDGGDLLAATASHGAAESLDLAERAVRRVACKCFAWHRAYASRMHARASRCSC